MADLLRRKDELIRSRHALLGSQSIIYEFHLDQVARRAQNHSKFVNNHRRYFTEIREKKDDIDKELVQAEQELEDLMNQNIEEKLEEAVREQERE